MFRLLALIMLLGAIVGSAWFYRGYSERQSQAPPYRTEQVKRGDLLITVGATGTIEPEEVVDVGAQVVGRIKELGKDPRGKTDPKYAEKPVDYGSPVEQGMVLAQIDPSVYEAQFDQATAALAQAEANVAQSQARVHQTEAEWQRAQKLKNLKIPSRSPTGTNGPNQSLPIVGIADADFILARANAESAQADLAAAQATVLQQRAALKLATTNLTYTTIKSPVRGVILDRRVNIGQTVVANLNAPSLFLIAKDLQRMQVWASVNEADIGSIRVDMPVRFTVDAFPARLFQGTVTQVRMNATMSQNVVTYTVVVTTDNKDGTLLPYLTANVQFEIEVRAKVLLVPNAALRWRPPDPQVAAHVGPVAEVAEPAEGQEYGRLWVPVEGGLVRGVDVLAGATDGTNTEVTGSGVVEGMQVVVADDSEQEGKASDADGAKNPFLPKLPSRRPPPGPM